MKKQKKKTKSKKQKILIKFIAFVYLTRTMKKLP